MLVGKFAAGVVCLILVLSVAQIGGQAMKGSHTGWELQSAQPQDIDSKDHALVLTEVEPLMGQSFPCQIDVADSNGTLPSPTPLYDFVNAIYFRIRVVAGWNLISVPFNSSFSQFPRALLDQDNDTLWDRIMWYDAFDTANLWKQYYVGWSPSLNDLAVVNQTMGIWINVTFVGDGYLNLAGEAAGTTHISLKKGWNLIGYPTLNATMTVSDALWGTGATIIETFDPSGTYRVAAASPMQLMRPGAGYWIHIPADTVWVVDW
jgi:hypothetical protein